MMKRVQDKSKNRLARWLTRDNRRQKSTQDKGAKMHKFNKKKKTPIVGNILERIALKSFLEGTASGSFDLDKLKAIWSWIKSI